MHPEVELLDQKSQAPLDGDQRNPGETQTPRLADLLEDMKCYSGAISSSQPRAWRS